MDCITNQKLILIQQKIKNWSSQYKKKGTKRYWDRQMEDYEILVDDIQIKKYCESSHAQEAFSIFRELHLKERKLSQSEYCTICENLFVIIELGNAHRSGSYANMSGSESDSKSDNKVDK